MYCKSWVRGRAQRWCGATPTCRASIWHNTSSVSAVAGGGYDLATVRRSESGRSVITTCELWRARRDSDPRPLASEANTLIRWSCRETRSWMVASSCQALRKRGPQSVSTACSQRARGRARLMLDVHTTLSWNIPAQWRATAAGACSRSIGSLARCSRSSTSRGCVSAQRMPSSRSLPVQANSARSS